MRYLHVNYINFKITKERGLSLRSRNKYIPSTPYGIVLSSHSKISLGCSLNKSKYSHNTYNLKLIKCYVLPLGLEPRILTLKGCSFTNSAIGGYVLPSGLEPEIHCLRDSCFNQFSYESILLLTACSISTSPSSAVTVPAISAT